MSWEWKGPKVTAKTSPTAPLSWVGTLASASPTGLPVTPAQHLKHCVIVI